MATQNFFRCSPIPEYAEFLPLLNEELLSFREEIFALTMRNYS